MNEQILLELKHYLEMNSEEIDYIVSDCCSECLPLSNLRPRQQIYNHRSETDIEEYLRIAKTEETFSTMILKYIDQTGLADVEIYKRAGIDRRHFSKIRCNKEYRPKKATAVSLCLALKLELDKVEELLKLAGYSLSSSDTGDLIVKFCVEKGMFDLMDVNYVLEYFGVKALGVVG
ncbi:MAG: hypothetical protein ACYDEX_04710 [Mobilitalea sp.]